MSLPKTVILLVVGAAAIAVGANLLVDNGTLIAQALGVPESVIALTKKKLYRGQGILMLAIYVAFCVVQFVL